MTIVGRDGTRIAHPRQRFGAAVDRLPPLPAGARAASRRRCGRSLPELLRDLGAPFPAVWAQLADGAWADARPRGIFAQGPRPARDARRRARRRRALTRALATGTPLLLALTPATPAPDRCAADAVPAALRDIEVASGLRRRLRRVARGRWRHERAPPSTRDLDRHAHARAQAAGRRARPSRRSRARRARRTGRTRTTCTRCSAPSTRRATSRSIRQRLREARFPEVKTLDTFDFAAAEGVSATQVHTLARGEWVDRARESDPRRARSAPARRIWRSRSASRPRKQKRRVLFTRAADLVRQLARGARRARARPPAAAPADASTCSIIDELGFVPFDRVGGELLFNLITDRYERRATVVTTNLAFAEWVTVFARRREAHHRPARPPRPPRHGHHDQGQELPDAEAKNQRRMTRRTGPSQRGQDSGPRGSLRVQSRPPAGRNTFRTAHSVTTFLERRASRTV